MIWRRHRTEISNDSQNLTTDPTRAAWYVERGLTNIGASTWQQTLTQFLEVWPVGPETAREEQLERTQANRE